MTIPASPRSVSDLWLNAAGLTMGDALDTEGGEQTTVTLWVLRKDAHVMTCVLSGGPGHRELQVLMDQEVYLNEIHTVRDGAIGRARTLLRGFEAHGWTPERVEKSIHGSDPPPGAR
ncbi:MAG: hypothetical protein ABI868_06120 [Acidobacteriota bacterium]